MEKSNKQAHHALPPAARPRPPHQNCPRCSSSNTKFCYYNNHSLSQPRHYCKDCYRYWTQGGRLRNIPIGDCSQPDKRKQKSTASPQEKKPQESVNLETRAAAAAAAPKVPQKQKESCRISTTAFIPIAPTPAPPMCFPSVECLAQIEASEQFNVGDQNFSLPNGYSASLLQRPQQFFYMGGQDYINPLEEREILPLTKTCPPQQDWQKSFGGGSNVVDFRMSHLSTTGSSSSDKKSIYFGRSSLNLPSFPDLSGFDPPL